MAVTPDLGPCILAPHEGVVLGDAAVEVQARNLAEVAVEILRLADSLGDAPLSSAR